MRRTASESMAIAQDLALRQEDVDTWLREERYMPVLS